jgi:hypothetical protein
LSRDLAGQTRLPRGKNSHEKGSVIFTKIERASSFTITHQIRNYLWRQPFILRFNEDGKKAKSKGNHIWNIEAKKAGDNKWEFRPFHRKLAGNPPSVAYCGLKWSWTPRVWDPQASFQNVPVKFSSPSLPSWLSWKEDVLSGIPPPDAEDCTIAVNANVRGVIKH